MSRYNATVSRIDPDTVEVLGCFLAEVDDAGLILRSNWLQFTGLEGTTAYDQYIRRMGAEFRIDRDGGEGYPHSWRKLINISDLREVTRRL